MLRTVVLRTVGTSTVNINDEIGLDSFLSYTLKDHLEDLERYEGLRILAVEGDVYVFSDSSVVILQQTTQKVNVAGLDPATRSLIVAESLMRFSNHHALAPLPSLVA